MGVDGRLRDWQSLPKATMSKMVQEIKEDYTNAMGHLAKHANTPGFPGKCLRKQQKMM